jgi:hypothetical protein
MISLQPREFIREDYVISTDPSRLDLNWIHNYLTNDAYWARGIPYQMFKKSVENALCFGVYHQEKQVGFSPSHIRFRHVCVYWGCVYRPDLSQARVGEMAP